MALAPAMRALFGRRRNATVEELRETLDRFRDLVEHNDRVLELIADAGEKLGGEYVFDSKYLHDLAAELREATHAVVTNLNAISGDRYPELLDALSEIDGAIQAALECRLVVPEAPYVVSLEDAGTEHLDVVGAKMARLGEVRSRLGCAVPDGFVVTTHACLEFVEGAGVLDAVETLRADFTEGRQGLEEEARRIRERVLDAPLPRKLSRVLRREAARLARSADGSGGLLAVRSSGVDEDGELSFAGQYETVLGVSPEEVEAAYRTVVASLYAPGALHYQRQHLLPPACGFMGVGILRMVPARASGVVYSVDPSAPERNVLVVSAALGLGKPVVEGGAAVDRLEVSRDRGHEVVARRIARKERRFVAVRGSGAVPEPVPEAERGVAALSDAELGELAATARRIEQYMRGPQDIEWAVDHGGLLFILQTRPLRVATRPGPVERDLTDVVGRYPVLLRGRGEVACRGIGSGSVHAVTSSDVRPTDIPAGAVLVARAATPRLGGLLAGASAVVTDLGSATGHFAAVARDLRVPTIVDAGLATRVLEEGLEVTVDAEDNVVYEGRFEELLRYQLLRESSFGDAAEFRLLRRMLRRVAPLRLRDPTDPSFSAGRCTTYHDVIRFAHEKAISELVEIGWIKPPAGVRYVRRLDLPIPLDLILVDLGGGFRVEGDRPTAIPADITSRPLGPLLEELTAGGAWETAPANMDLDGFMSSATRSMSLTGVLAARPQQNLAFVSREYLHLSLRLGYHFNIVDTHLGDAPADNYIYFRFAGGVTELTRRTRRAALLTRILAHHGFVAEARGDLVVGRIKGLGAGAMIERLRMVGRLIGFTRQL
ncbi:MAG TPA: PEP/pyruvate-binding domain-containing protein, partial [Longimicrobiales bacterium]|nr:PEP/pyruvate-binding domain-containing protein [Longimicrobiales bacterium]